MRLSILNPPHCLIREDMSRTLTFTYSKSPEEVGVHCKCSNLTEEAEVTTIHSDPDPNVVAIYGCFEHWLRSKGVWFNFKLYLKLKSNIKLDIQSRGSVGIHAIFSSWYGTSSSTVSTVCQ